jgi:hypothetical protein
MALKVIPQNCAECDAPDSKIIYIFTREHYCGAYCTAEGFMKLTRMFERAKAEGIEHG